MPSITRHRTAPAATALALALAATLARPGPALAHAVVVASDPPAGAVLDAAPSRVAVRFNSRIDQSRSRLTLVGPVVGQEASAVALQADPDTDPVALSAAVPDALAPGAWRLRWQVLAVDGHITRGDIPFTLRPR